MLSLFVSSHQFSAPTVAVNYVIKAWWIPTQCTKYMLQIMHQSTYLNMQNKVLSTEFSKLNMRLKKFRNSGFCPVIIHFSMITWHLSGEIYVNKRMNPCFWHIRHITWFYSVEMKYKVIWCNNWTFLTLRCFGGLAH